MRLFPKEENFFDFFEKLADKIEEGGKFFLEMTRNCNYSETKAARLKELEHEADIIAHTAYDKLHKTFLTPIDREDIYMLLNKMDSVIDVIESTGISICMYKVTKYNDKIIKQVDILLLAIKKKKEIIYDLRNMKNAQKIMDECVEIHTLENEGDTFIRNTIKNLFAEEKDAIELLKWKEIFENIEEAIDNCEAVCNIIEGIVLKHA
ncbi:MAG: DUF47 family protein [Syntrophaceae bacterium]|nr:DUF47 family protein [Syntrophaceae bacterium]